MKTIKKARWLILCLVAILGLTIFATTVLILSITPVIASPSIRYVSLDGLCGGASVLVTAMCKMPSTRLLQET
jgi:hypothetical protein